VVVAAVVTWFGWKQYFVTGAPVTACEYSQARSEHMENPFAPHFSIAAVRSMHWHGAWQETGAGVVVVTWWKQ
jgi:hypothetical protein